MNDSIPRDRPLFNRDFNLVTLFIFIFFFNYHAFILLPLRIEELGGSESVIGFIMGAASMATILTTPSVGILIDKWGRKPFLIAGGILISLATIPFAYLHTIDFLFPLLRVLHGAALSLSFVAAGTLIADVSSPGKRSLAIGIFGMFSVMNFALAPYIGKLMVDAYGFDDFFIFCSILGVPALLAASFIREPHVHRGSEGVRGSFIGALRRRGVMAAAFALVVAGTGFVPAITFVPIFAVRIGIGAFELFFITYTVVILAVRIFFGWLPDKYGKKLVSIPALFVFSASIAGLGLVTDSLTLVIAGIFFGAGHGLFYPAIYALVIDLTPDEDRGKAVSICSVAFTFGGMLGVFAYGVTAELEGFRTMFAIAGAVCTAGFLVFALYGKDSRKAPRSA